jgi:hypothetical protein
MNTPLAVRGHPRSYPRPPDPVPAVLARPAGSGAVLTCQTPECQRHRDAHHAHCPDCTDRVLLRAIRGQALAEFVLILPLMLLLVFGGLEAALLATAKAQQDRTTQTLADWTAAHPGDNPYATVAALSLDGCDVATDEDPALGLVTVWTTCDYSPVTYAALAVPISSEASAAMAPTPEPTP